MKREISLSMRKEWLASKRKAFSLVEIILATSLFSLLVLVLISSYLYGEESTMLAGSRARATLLAEEGVEIMRNMRDGNFTNLTDGTYGLVQSGANWILSGTSDVTGIFTRSIIISTVDGNRKSIVSNVTWQQNVGRTGLVSLTSRFTNWTRIVAIVSNWTSPVIKSTLDISGNNDGVKVQISGNYAYVVMDKDTDFLVIDISNPSAPTLVGSLSLPGTLSNLYIKGNYAYVTSSDNSAELIIVNITNPNAPVITSTYNNVGNSNANGVFVAGNYAYLTFSGGNDLVIVNVSVPSSPVFVGGTALYGQAFEVVVAGNYAYVTTTDKNRELQVVKINIPTLPLLVGTLDLSGSSDALTIALSGTVALIGQGDTLYTVNVANPVAPTVISSISAYDTINDIALNFGGSNTYAYIATDDNDREFQVINFANPAALSLVSSVDTPDKDDLLGVAYDATLDRAVGVGKNKDSEMFIFTPQ